MKKIFTIASFAILTIACKPTENKKSQQELRGNWELVSVQHSKDYKVTSFNISDAKCLEGSQWKFVANNNIGKVTLAEKNNCPEFSSNIIWNINTNNEFNLKFIGDEKAKNVKYGYKLHLVNLTSESFQLLDNSASTEVIYTFKKTSK